MTSIPDSSVNISKFSWVITGISIIQILSQQKGSLTYRMVNDFLCISNFRKPRLEKRVLGCSFTENFSIHFCGEFIVPVQKSSGILEGGSVLTTACPTPQIQKVSSWSLCQVRFQLLFPSLSENLGFFLQILAVSM